MSTNKGSANFPSTTIYTPRYIIFCVRSTWIIFHITQRQLPWIYYQHTYKYQVCQNILSDYICWAGADPFLMGGPWPSGKHAGTYSSAKRSVSLKSWGHPLATCIHPIVGIYSAANVWMLVLMSLHKNRCKQPSGESFSSESTAAVDGDGRL